mmetsp:Transcript_4932/g.8573  ORF Transcript_4932/g.8573 Transcript_4932/m.8573 type:complete len:231 (-) Transcript_4932:1049-1741(-)
MFDCLLDDLILKVSEYLDIESYTRLRCANRRLFTILQDKTPLFIKLCLNRNQNTKEQNEFIDVILESYSGSLFELWQTKSIYLSNTIGRLSDRKTSDVSMLSGFENVVLLDLRFTQVSDISALSTLTKLHTLDLSGTRVSDISALSALKTLKYLHLNHSNVACTSVLLTLMNIQWIYVDEIQDASSPVLKPLKNRGETVHVIREDSVLEFDESEDGDSEDDDSEQDESGR